jgi:hypothetical protein
MTTKCRGTSGYASASVLVPMRSPSTATPRSEGDLAPGRDEDVLRLDLRRVRTFDDDAKMLRSTRRHETTAALIPSHLVLLEQEGDAGRVLLHDDVLAREHFRQIELDARDVEAEERRTVLGVGEALARLEKRLARNASDSNARAPELRLELDARRVEPELRGANRRDVPAGARPNHDEVMFGHVKPREGSAPVLRRLL